MNKNKVYRFRVMTTNGKEYTSVAMTMGADERASVERVITNMGELTHFQMDIFNKHGGKDTMYFNAKHIVSITAVEPQEKLA